MQPPLPPGEDPRDPRDKEIDPVGFALERVQTHLDWIEEHLLSFVSTRESDPKIAEQELANLTHSVDSALMRFARLRELIVTGYSIDPKKRLPRLPWGKPRPGPCD